MQAAQLEGQSWQGWGSACLMAKCTLHFAILPDLLPLFDIAGQSFPGAQQIDVFPSGLNVGAINFLRRRESEHCSTHPVVPGDLLKHRLAHTFSIYRWFQFTSPFCPSIRLLRRRALGRRLDNSRCRTDKGCSSIGFPPLSWPCKSPDLPQ